MPAAAVFCTSSAKALAVMAQMGTSFESARSEALMSRTASYPSMTGICISIRIRSYVCGEEASNSSTASFPFSAQSVVTPVAERISSAISRFIMLSSARRMRFLLRSGTESSELPPVREERAALRPLISDFLKNGTGIKADMPLLLAWYSISSQSASLISTSTMELSAWCM